MNRVHFNFPLTAAELSKTGGTVTKVLPNFNVKDSVGQTVLALSLWGAMHDVADRLLNSGADINEKNSVGMTLIHQVSRDLNPK